MENPGTPGLRLLSLDGGGIRGLSMLIILRDLMWKLKGVENLPEVPRPCDYFDLIGGTSTGGLIALMLGRLQMSVEDAMKAYGELSKEVFSDVKSKGHDGRFKASKLEKAIKRIVGRHSASQDPEDGIKDTRENVCKTFVCTMNAANMSLPVLFRTYDATHHPAMDCTIWQAGRATSAAPTFFKQIQIGPPGIEEAFLDGGMGQNNPTAALLREAEVVFPDRHIAVIISLGTGQPHTINIPKPSGLQRLFPLDVVEAIKGIATDCEKEHQSFAHYFDSVPHVYFRFNVERGMQDIQLNQWEKLGDVAANTRQYILSHPVESQLADAVKSLVEKIGRVPTTSLNAVPTEFNQSKATLNFLRCPPPSQIFRGRQDILDKMHEYFSGDIQGRHAYVLYGLGGSGKTQIALKFLDTTNRQPTPRFTKQFFINASSCQTLDTAFKNIAISHEIGKNSQDALHWLISQIEPWMLLFDNADDPSIDLFPFFPKCTHGNIIITSRNPELAVHGQSHSRVGDMDETDAIDLLLVRAVKEKTIQTTEKASEIVKELSCLPLALIQAGAYIAKFNCLPQYLSIYKENRAKLLSQHPVQSHDDYGRTVYTTWAISFVQLSKEARRFLQICSLLHHDSIPEAIFQQAAAWIINHEKQEEAQTLQEARVLLCSFLSHSGIWDTQRFLDIVAEIQGYSLIDRDAVRNTLSIHPLVQSWCQNTLDNESGSRECMIDIMGMSMKLTDNYLFRIGLMPHLECLIQDPINIKSVFQYEYAHVYFDSGRYTDAEPLACVVLEKRKQLLGADHPDTLSAMGNLAATYQQLGRYTDAEPLEGVVLEKRKQLLGADHPDTLWAMANLAGTYRELGRYTDAEPLEVVVLEKRKQLLGADHPDTLLATANLAATYRRLGRYTDAEPLEGVVLEKRKQLLGTDHPDTLSAMVKLAATYRHLGRYADAEALDRVVLEKRKRLLCADHP
ncbi:acyl transferase/acyl hydrolase/lysophospholipase [Mycena metata]|uniref:Acyl transferase/acyl hydrolase/lysophospholipase n=1 Tax=Mycena metata TaxID=1033252 RepID=A0AAD7JRR7_9AGAR|nr:acyl transferase/acyl hydrolase/lysophospholipase [Mycena metata]